MSNARNLAKLLPNSSGELLAANLASSAVTETKIADTAVTNAKIAAMAASKLTDTIEQARMYSGAVLNHTVYTNSTRYSLGAAATSTIYSFSYTKTYGTDTKLVIQGLMPCWSNYNGGTYMFIDIDGTKSYAGFVDVGGGSGDTLGVIFEQVWTGLSASTKTIGIGWSTNDGTSNYPFERVHPNSSDDGRNRQQSSLWNIWEVKA